MISSSKNYIEGFIETCYKYGIHEKQAAALLNIAQIREGISTGELEKEAKFRTGWEAIKTIGRGFGLLGKGTGQLAAIPLKGSGSALKAVGSGVGSGAKSYGNFLFKGQTPGNALARTLAYGALPLGGAISAVGPRAKKLWGNFGNSDMTGATESLSGSPQPSTQPSTQPSPALPQHEAPVNATQGTYGEEGPLISTQDNENSLATEIARRDASFADAPARRMEWMRSADRQNMINERDRIVG